MNSVELVEPVATCLMKLCALYFRFHVHDILLHEISHGVHLLGASFVIPGFERRLQETYASAIKKKIWDDEYASTNVMEYWVNVF